MSITFARRTLVAVASLFFALTGPLLIGPALIGTAPAAVAAPETNSTASWLVSQLENDLAPSQYGGADYGLSIDVMLALNTLGGQDGAVGDMADALSADPQAYISGEAFGDAGSTYAGAAGKLAASLQVVGRDATDVNGVDVLARAADTVVTTGDEAGRASDISTYGDYSNAIGQSWVVRALATGDSSLAQSAVDYLLLQQCPSGAFRLSMYAAGTIDRACGDPTTADDDAVSYDATAFAVTALTVAREAGLSGTEQPLADAVAALAAAQGPSGSLDDMGTANTNTTGLAAQALALGGRAEAAVAARDFVDSLRVDDSVSGPLASEVGAIAYSAEAYEDGKDAGITAMTRDQWLRATAQAALALVVDDVPGGETPAPTTPAPTTPAPTTSSPTPPTESESPTAPVTPGTGDSDDSDGTAAPGTGGGGDGTEGGSGGGGLLPDTGAAAALGLLAVGAAALAAGAVLIRRRPSVR